MKIDGKVIAYFAFVSIVVICICDAVVHNNKINIIDKKGVELVARITKVRIANGYNISFVYYYDGVLYKNQGNTTRFACAVGDSILIMVLPEEPNGTFKLEGKANGNRLRM